MILINTIQENKEDNGDILIMIKQNKGHLFDVGENDVNTCTSIERIKFILFKVDIITINECLNYLQII